MTWPGGGDEDGAPENNWSDLAGDGVVAGNGEGDVGGGTREQCGSNEECTVDLAGDGVVAGGGGGDVGGAPESSVGATKSAPVPPTELP